MNRVKSFLHWIFKHTTKVEVYTPRGRGEISVKSLISDDDDTQHVLAILLWSRKCKKVPLWCWCKIKTLENKTLLSSEKKKTF